MKCARCGAVIQEGANMCHSCGLKIKAPPRPDTTPSEKIPTPQDVTENQHSLQHELAKDYLAPGEIPFQGRVRTAPLKEKYGLPSVPIAIVLIGLLVIAIAGATYFFVLRKKGLSEPELAVHAYFDAISSGNAESVKACFVPESQPDEERLANTLNAISRSKIKMEPKTKLISQSESEAKVEIVGVKVSTSTGGNELTTNLEKLFGYSAKAIVRLKKQEGRWLIYVP